ncbi:BA71V-EP153R [African swine fever virus]|nr:BA71V-EP153R [African swine fever virus]
MYSKKKYIGLIDKYCEKKILDDFSTIIYWEYYITCNQTDKMFYCPKDWVGYNNVCYYFNASNSCKKINSTLANNDTNLLNLNYSLIKNYYKKQKH